MQPTEYLLVLSGLCLGVPVGFAIAAAITAGRIRHASKQSWAAAARFYRLRQAESAKS